MGFYDEFIKYWRGRFANTLPISFFEKELNLNPFSWKRKKK